MKRIRTGIKKQAIARCNDANSDVCGDAVERELWVIGDFKQGAREAWIRGTSFTSPQNSLLFGNFFAHVHKYLNAFNREYQCGHKRRCELEFECKTASAKACGWPHMPTQHQKKHIHTQVHVHVHTHPSDALTLSHTRADVLGGIAQIVHQLLVVLEGIPVDFFQKGLLRKAAGWGG